MAKRAKPECRDISEIMAEVKEMASMRCKPAGNKFPAGYVIDEEKSVRWNRDEVQAHNKAYDEEVKALNCRKNEWRDRLWNEIAEYIVAQLSGKASVAGARRIWEYAYEQGHSMGITEVFTVMNDLLDLFIAALDNQKPDKSTTRR